MAKAYASGITDMNWIFLHPLDMLISGVPHIVAAERLKEGLVIKFDNGQCAFYSSAFLLSKLPECEELNEADVEW